MKIWTRGMKHADFLGNHLSHNQSTYFPARMRLAMAPKPEVAHAVSGFTFLLVREPLQQKISSKHGNWRFWTGRSRMLRQGPPNVRCLISARLPRGIGRKCLKSDELLPHMSENLMDKNQDHLPLYRQEGIVSRVGLAIPQSTRAQWVGQVGVQLQALVDAVKAELLAFPVLHADEKLVAMLDRGPARPIGPICAPTASAPMIQLGR